MHRIKQKAILISTVGHVAALLLVFQLGQSKPVKRGYPTSISATLMRRAPQPQQQQQQQSTAAAPKIEKPVSKPAPIKKKEEPKPKTPAPSTPQPPPSTATPSIGNASQDMPSAGGVARLDAPMFEFPHYLGLLQLRIENQWQPPPGSGSWFATIHFVISKTGRIISAEVERGSGNFAFDQAALRAIRNANPLPALPEGYSDESLGVHFDFVVN